jgi:hypothetical protein
MIAPNRLRFQYSLRSLLVFMLVASIGMSWFGAKWRAARQQRDAVAAIRALGGEVIYDYVTKWAASGATAGPPVPPGPAWARRLLGEDFFAGVVEVRPGERFRWSNNGMSPFTDEWLEHVGKLPGLESLKLESAPVTDAGVAKLEGLTHLRYLILECPRVTDAGLAHVGNLSGLEVLDLYGTQVTGTGLARLEGLMRLRDLFLNCTCVTDAGLAHIEGLSSLEVLDLHGTGVTDTGLDHLRRLSRLRRLDLHGTHVTPGGVAKLQRALPKCEISYASLPATPSEKPE